MVESGSFSLTMETFEEWEHSQDDRSYKKSLIAYKNELIEQFKAKGSSLPSKQIENKIVDFYPTAGLASGNLII